MSLAGTIVQAVKTARREMGDLIQPTVLRVMTDRQYVDGRYVNQYDPRDVEVVMDKFTFHEQQLEDFQQTDVKLVLFNPNNDLRPTIQDQMTWNGRDIPIIKSEPVYVGGHIPVWTIVLRQ